MQSFTNLSTLFVRLVGVWIQATRDESGIIYRGSAKHRDQESLSRPYDQMSDERTLASLTKEQRDHPPRLCQMNFPGPELPI